MLTHIVLSIDTAKCLGEHGEWVMALAAWEGPGAPDRHTADRVALKLLDVLLPAGVVAPTTMEEQP